MQKQPCTEIFKNKMRSSSRTGSLRPHPNICLVYYMYISYIQGIFNLHTLQNVVHRIYTFRIVRKMSRVTGDGDRYI